MLGYLAIIGANYKGTFLSNTKYAAYITDLYDQIDLQFVM